MANEITLNIKLDYSNGGIKSTMIAADDASLDVAANQIFRNTALVDTATAILDIGDIATVGYIIMTNRHATGVITFYNTSGEAVSLMELNPGESCCYKLSAGGQVIPYHKSTVSDSQLEYMVVAA